MLKRREFLAATWVSASGALLVGCGSDDEPSSEGERLLSGDAYFPQSVCSGDPRETSVILWTRLVDGEAGDQDLELELQVAKDEQFKERVDLNPGGNGSASLSASRKYDGCVKVRVTSLQPGAYYWYRFIYRRAGEAFVTRVGRTRTAPPASADVGVRFAVASCQDYNGKYYHVYKHMVEQDIDFFVHLGDYIYETTADPQFQTATPDRAVKLSDQEGAIVFNQGTEKEYYAAGSLNNYRELYQIYRGDQDLQRAHELFPMIAIWDDHEFSDDCYGVTATYTDGREDEAQPARRASADQAWFEYMPVDYQPDPSYQYEPGGNFPEDMTIYRDFSFGKHMHLVMTDLRRYRPDHLVPEDVFPGAVAVSEAELSQYGGSQAAARPYIDIAAYDGGSYQAALKTHADKTEFDAAQFEGLVSVDFINGLLTDINPELPTPIPLIDEAEAGLLRGYSFDMMMKSDRFGQIGSRYLVAKDIYDCYARKQYALTDGASEALMGDEQERWFLDKMKSSTSTWKIWGNEFTFMPRVVDLSEASSLPALFQKKFSLSAEDWDGSPNKRAELLAELARVENVVVITGDIHAFFTGSLRAPGGGGLNEFVCSGISSGTYKTLLAKTAESSPSLAAVGAVALALGVGQFLTDPQLKPNPHLAYQAYDMNGYATFELDAQQLSVRYHAISEEKVATKELGSTISAHFSTTEFRVKAGSVELYQPQNGGEKRWDIEQARWV